MGELVCDRLEMLEHVDAVAEYVAKYTTLTAKQAYIALVGCVNDLLDENKPKGSDDDER